MSLPGFAGRTCPSPGNSLGTDLLVINDSGAYIYKPTRARSAPIEIQSEDDYEKVLKWYDEGLIQILDQRPRCPKRTGAQAGVRAGTSLGRPCRRCIERG